MRVRVLLLLLAVLLIAASVQAEVTDLSYMKAYWAMDEGTGDYAMDSSDYGNHGLLVADSVHGDNSDPLPGSTQPDWIAGHDGTGTALQFCSGDDNYNSVWVAKSDSLKDLYGYWSFTMWIRQDNYDVGPSGGGYDRVISCPNYEIELDNDDGWGDYFWPYGTSSFQTDIGPTYTHLGGNLGEWYHFALTYDGVDLKKYLNGTLVDTYNNPGKGINNIWDDAGWTDAALKLGCQTWPNKDWLEGALDDVAIYAGQYLSADQVAGLADGTLAPNSVPEPLTIVLLGFGGLLLRKRR